jgi:hypothetical protein
MGAIHGMVHSLHIILSIIFPDQIILKGLANSESHILRRAKSARFRGLLLERVNPGEIKQSEDSEKVENDIPYKLVGKN